MLSENPLKVILPLNNHDDITHFNLYNDEEYHLPEYGAVQSVRNVLTLRRNVFPPNSYGL
jgi:hypothetical protein